MKEIFPVFQQNIVIGILFTLTFSLSISYAQVGIGNTAPNSDALLELGNATTTTAGLLLPRVNLLDTSNPSPLSTDVQGMVVYNKNTAGDVTPGFYYNDGTDWIRIEAGTTSDDWTTTGNTGTNPGTKFIGTTDNQDVVIKTNSIEKMRIGISETVVNENSNDYDFRVESNLESDMFMVNANEDQVFIKANTQHLGYIDALSSYANSVGSSTIGIQYAIAGWNQGNQGGGGNFVIEDVTNPFAAMEASTDGTGIANRGLITSTTSAAIATSGTSNDSDSWAVYGSVPTTGTWLGYGGVFTGGLGYANGIYNVSDARAKRDIKEIRSNSALDKILYIKGYTYKYDLKKYNSKSAEDDRTYYGFMAQNIEEYLPFAVAQKKIPFRNEYINARSTRKESGTEEILNVVDYTAIIPILVEAVKEQQIIIEEQNNKINKLELTIENISKN